jgi:hypothetical protein
MAVHLVCYADNRFRNAQARLTASAVANGAEVVHAFGPDDFHNDPFFERHRHLLGASRGAGYCLWKPFVIRKVLGEIGPDDFLLYADCGATLIADVHHLADACRAADGLLLFRNPGRKNRYWVKRDGFVLVGADTPACHDADQVYASFSGYFANPRAIEFVDEWLARCTDPRLLTDLPNTCGLPDLPEFIVNMYDQSVLSVLAHQRAVPLYRDPSEKGNHLKPVELRVRGEPIELPYSTLPDAGSSYPTMFDHSRTTGPPAGFAERVASVVKASVRRWMPKKWPNPHFREADLSDAIEKNRKALAEVGNWHDPNRDTSVCARHGTPPQALRNLNPPVGKQATLSDLVVHLASRLCRPLDYFELGVATGKNFFQVMRACQGGRLTGLDIIDIHANLASHLVPVRTTEWEPSPEAQRRPSSMHEYIDRSGNNAVSYLAADVFDEAAWQRLSGRRFNCLFFDTLHCAAEAWFRAWTMIRRHDLLDVDEFVLVWDDLGGYMSTVFDRVAADVVTLVPDTRRLLVRMRGLGGVNEWPHQVGALVHLKQPPPWLRQIVPGVDRLTIPAGKNAPANRTSAKVHP